jgi:hypothetical protein
VSPVGLGPNVALFRKHSQATTISDPSLGFQGVEQVSRAGVDPRIDNVLGWLLSQQVRLLFPTRDFGSATSFNIDVGRYIAPHDDFFVARVMADELDDTGRRGVFEAAVWIDDGRTDLEGVLDELAARRSYGPVPPSAEAASDAASIAAAVLQRVLDNIDHHLWCIARGVPSAVTQSLGLILGRSLAGGSLAWQFGSDETLSTARTLVRTGTDLGADMSVFSLAEPQSRPSITLGIGGDLDSRSEVIGLDALERPSTATLRSQLDTVRRRGRQGDRPRSERGAPAQAGRLEVPDDTTDEVVKVVALPQRSDATAHLRPTPARPKRYLRRRQSPGDIGAPVPRTGLEASIHRLTRLSLTICALLSLHLILTIVVLVVVASR